MTIGRSYIPTNVRWWNEEIMGQILHAYSFWVLYNDVHARKDDVLDNFYVETMKATNQYPGILYPHLGL